MARKENPYSDIDHVNVTDYGSGKWYWQHSWECSNPRGPVATLKLGPEFLLMKMTCLVSVKRSWIIRTSLPYLVRSCHGKIKRSAVAEHLRELRDRGFVKLLVTDKKKGNVYLVNPIMMSSIRAPRMKHYEQASQLVIRERSEIPPRKKKRKARSREVQLAIAKRQAELEKSALGAASPAQ